MPRALIIDDNETFKVALGRLLQRAGWQTEALASPIGAHARILSKDDPIDVVVLDCVMPALPGPALLAMLARNERTATVPVVLISGLSDPSHIEAARKHPNARYVQKTDPMAIVAAVKDMHTTRTRP
jgi:CheY-like chemotaxis protein